MFKSYDKFRQQFGTKKNLKLCFSDMDSFLFQVKCGNLIHKLKEMEHMLTFFLRACACTFSGKKMLHLQENVALSRKCCICKKMLQVASRNLLLQKQDFLANATFSCKCKISCH